MPILLPEQLLESSYLFDSKEGQPEPKRAFCYLNGVQSIIEKFDSFAKISRNLPTVLDFLTVLTLIEDIYVAINIRHVASSGDLFQNCFKFMSQARSKFNQIGPKKEIKN